MKKSSAHTEIDAVQLFGASGFWIQKKSSIWHPEWHVDAYSVIGRLQTTSATNPPVVTDQDVPLHPINLLCNSYYHLPISTFLSTSL